MGKITGFMEFERRENASPIVPCKSGSATGDEVHGAVVPVEPPEDPGVPLHGLRRPLSATRAAPSAT